MFPHLKYRFNNLGKIKGPFAYLRNAQNRPYFHGAFGYLKDQPFIKGAVQGMFPYLHAQDNVLEEISITRMARAQFNNY